MEKLKFSGWFIKNCLSNNWLIKSNTLFSFVEIFNFLVVWVLWLSGRKEETLVRSDKCKTKTYNSFKNHENTTQITTKRRKRLGELQITSDGTIMDGRLKRGLGERTKQSHVLRLGWHDGAQSCRITLEVVYWARNEFFKYECNHQNTNELKGCVIPSDEKDVVI